MFAGAFLVPLLEDLSKEEIRRTWTENNRPWPEIEADKSDFERIAQELQESEEARDQAAKYLQKREAELISKLT